MDMSRNTNNTPYEREEPNQYHSAHRQCNASAPPSHSLSNQVHWARESHYQSGHASAGITSNTNSWPSVIPADLSSVMYEGVWPNEHCADDAHLGSIYDTSGGNIHELEVSVSMGLEGSTSMLEPVAPNMLDELHTTQFLLDWMQHSNSSGQLAFSWGPPVLTSMQHSDHGSYVDSGGMSPEISPFNPGLPPVNTGYPEHIDSSTGGSAVYSASTVQPLDRCSPTSSDSSSTPTPTRIPRPRGERWPLSNANTFRCMWRSHGMLCSALIPGDRKSVSSHLRDVHDFTCDGRLMACEWGDCTACMQRRNIPRHIVTRHFEVRVKCPYCGLSMSRADANRKHQLACRGNGSQNQKASGRRINSGTNRGNAQTRW